MPYKSKAERERERWMTLAEAVDWISKQDNCSWDGAKDQIRAALADNAAGPLRWEDQSASTLDYPPVDRHFWQKADIQRNGVFDPWGRWRTLLITKHMIFHLWPERSVASAGSGSGKTGPTTKAKRRGRPDAEIEIHQALDQLFQRGLNLKDMFRKEGTAAVNEECSKQFDVRTVKKYFQSWLEKHQTDA